MSAVKARYQIDVQTARTMGVPERTTNLEIASDALFREEENLFNRGMSADSRTVEAHRLVREVLEERKAMFGKPRGED